MSLEVRSDSYRPTIVPESPKEAALQIIQGLKGRVHQLEQELKREKIEYSQNCGAYEQQLFSERKRTAQLVKELTEAKALVEQGAQLIKKMEAQREQDLQVIQANREEIAALNRRIALISGQQREALDQVKVLQEQGNVLQQQMIGLVEKVNHLQRENLLDQQQVERDKKNRQPHWIESTMAYQIYAFASSLIPGKK